MSIFDSKACFKYTRDGMYPPQNNSGIAPKENELTITLPSRVTLLQLATIKF